MAMRNPLFARSADLTEEISASLTELFGESIPVDSHGVGIVVNYLFSIYDTEKLNKLFNHLLEKIDNDEDYKNELWANIPVFNPENFDGKFKLFLEEKKRVIEERRNNNGNFYNQTEPIPFDGGVVVPLNNSHRKILVAAIQKEIENSPSRKDKFELTCFLYGISSGNTENGTNLYFSILDKDGKAIGAIGLPTGGTVKLSRESGRHNYNFEYYMIHDYRRKGWMKSACAAVIEAVREEKISIFKNDPLLVYGEKSVPLPVKILNATVYKENIASQKVLESIPGFEHLGSIKFLRQDEDNEDGEVLDCVELYTLVV